MLGFDELLEADIGQHQLEECIALMFSDRDENKNGTTVSKINLNFEKNLANRIEKSDLIK